MKQRVYEILARLFPKFEVVFRSSLLHSTTIVEIIQSQFNFIFRRSSSVILKGMIYHKNFGDALNIPLFRLLSDKYLIQKHLPNLYGVK